MTCIKRARWLAARAVLSWAKAHGLRDGENPAEWRGHLEHALASPKKVTSRRRQPALPVNVIGAFMARLHREQKDLAAKALELVILTAARDGEVRGATWVEIDLNAGVWTIPAQRMKAGCAHRVPLLPAAAKLLKALPRIVGNAHLFPGASKLGRPSENTPGEVIKRLHERDAVPSDVPGRPAVVHGMRSTPAIGAEREPTSGPSCWSCRWRTPWAIRLSAPARVSPSSAPARDDALEQRTAIMVA